MNYDVLWVPSAENQLAELWLTANDRGAVIRASNTIDKALERDPVVTGESRSDGRRVLIELPLVVYYEIIPDDRRVRVLRVIGASRL